MENKKDKEVIAIVLGVFAAIVAIAFVAPAVAAMVTIGVMVAAAYLALA